MTFQELYDRYTTLTKNDSSDNVQLGKDMIDEYNLAICGQKDWYWLEKELTTPSVAGQQKYQFPPDYDRFMFLYAEYESTVYWPDYIASHKLWYEINNKTDGSSQSDIPTKFFLLEDYFYIYPAPSSASVTYHAVYKRKPLHMSQADYTTGTTSNTAGSDTVTGSGTTFTSDMEGRYIKGGGIWSEIKTYVSATQLTLDRPTIKGWSGETTQIGEVSPIPESFHDLLYLGPVAEYYEWKGPAEIATRYRKRYEKRLELFEDRYSKKTTKGIVRSRAAMQHGRINPNDYPRNMV